MPTSLKKYVLTSLLTVIASFFACRQLPSSSLSEDDSTSTTKIAVQKIEPSEEHNLFASVPGESSAVGVCASSQPAPCTKNSTGFKALTFLRKEGDRSIYRFPETIKFPTTTIFSVVDANDNKLRTFRFAGDSSPNQEGGDLTSSLSLIERSVMQQELTFLTRDEWRGRLAGTPENDAAADWIIEQIKGLGIQPGNNGQYKQSFTISKLGNVRSNNIIGVIPGNDPQLKNEFIVIGAHMDHAGNLQKGYTCSKGSASSNSICNGADDNGSGTVTLLNIAKALVKSKSDLKRSILIMWFSGEEEGLVGSHYFVNNPTIPLQNVKVMINLDMVGYLRQNNNRLFAIGTTAEKNEFKIAKKITEKYAGVSLNALKEAQGGSDHAPFMGKGIPAIFFHTGVSSNPNYHKTSDTVDQIDFAGMETAGRIAFETLHTFANAEKSTGFGLVSTFGTSLLPPSELDKTCHHLIFIEDESYKSLDFTNSNSGH